MRTNRKIFLLLFLFVTFCSYSQNKWTTLRISDTYSPKNDISAIQFDKAGNMWAGTWCGLYKMINGEWKSAGLQNVYIQTFYIDNQNTKWAGAWGSGLSKSDDGVSWTAIKDIQPAGSINIVTADHRGTIWVGDWNCGVFSYKSGKWNSYKPEQISLGDNTVTSIAFDSKNNKWLGTYHGITVYNELTGSKLYNRENSQLPANDVYSLCADSKNNIWIGTTNGLALFTGKSWTIYKKENTGLPSNLILSIAEDQKGFIWVGTDKGVSLFNGKKWITYTVENSSLVDNRVQTIKVRQNKIYIGTGKGLSIVEYN
jgi:ligand-binding sensor domain-containing protein